MAKSKINAYICDNLHITLTRQRDEGVTPMYIPCQHAGCPDMATSRMHQVNQKLTATHEWYSPNEEELQDMRTDMAISAFKALCYHVKQGGLLIKPIQ